MNNIQEQAAVLAIAHHFGALTTRELADWAADAIEGGAESKSLAMLASFLPSEPLADAYEYFLRVLGELDFRLPTEAEMLCYYAKKIAEDLRRGDITEWQAVSLMHSRVVVPLDHAIEFQSWCDLWCTISPTDPAGESDLGAESFRNAVRALATALASADPIRPQRAPN